MNVAKPKDKRPLPMPELLVLNRNAVTVYTALRWMAGDKRQLGTVRKRIRDVCHLSPEVITDAMHALRDANWLTFSYGQRDGTYLRWYRITFPQAEFFPVVRGQTARPATIKKGAKSPSPSADQDAVPRLENGMSNGSCPDRGSEAPASAHEGTRKEHPTSPGNGKVGGTIVVSEDGRRFVKLPSGALRPLGQNESPKISEA